MAAGSKKIARRRTTAKKKSRDFSEPEPRDDAEKYSKILQKPSKTTVPIRKKLRVQIAGVVSSLSLTQELPITIPSAGKAVKEALHLVFSQETEIIEPEEEKADPRSLETASKNYQELFRKFSACLENSAA